MTPADQQRFYDKVRPSSEQSCHLWEAATNPAGYGLFWLDGRMVLATHVALELDGRPRPNSAHALHKCDTPGCVNPSHLWWGTNRENIADRIAKGRPKPNGLSGEKHPRSSVTEKTVQIIRAEYDADVRGSVPRAARRFGMLDSHVRDILRRKTWKHLEDQSNGI